MRSQPKRLWLVAAVRCQLFILLRISMRHCELSAGFNFLVRRAERWASHTASCLVVCYADSGCGNGDLRKPRPDRPQRMFHGSVQYESWVCGRWHWCSIFMDLAERYSESTCSGYYRYACGVLPSLPCRACSCSQSCRNSIFCRLGVRRNLIYAVSATFLALLYLSLVRRVSLWMEPYLPPEASAAILAVSSRGVLRTACSE